MLKILSAVLATGLNTAMMSRCCLFVGAVVSVLAPNTFVRGQSTWTGLAAPDNSWTNAGNWDNGVPGSGVVARFNGAGNGNTAITLGGATQPIGLLSFDPGAAAYTIGQQPGDALDFVPHGSITANSSVTNPQTINATVRINGLGLTARNNVENGVSGTPGEGLVGLTLGAVHIVSGGVFALRHEVVSNVTTRLNGNITETADQPASVFLLGAVAGISNNSNIIINGNNTYSGGTTVQINTGTNGGIYIGTDTAFGTGKVTNVQQNNVPEYRAMNGTRTIANDFDLSGGINFNGTDGFVYTGDFAIISGTSRTLRNKISGATVTLGDNSGSSSFYLGNPADSVARTLILAPESTSMMTVNAVLKDPGSPGSLQFGGGTAGGIVLMNSLSTFTGPTLIGGGANCIVQFNRDYNAGGTSGPFGLGTLTTNNTGTLQPIGGNRTLANPVLISANNANSHLQVSNATGDTSGLTLTGPITMSTAGRSITNNFTASGGILTLGSSGSPTTFTLATAAGQTLTLGGTGRTVINDTIQDSPGIATNMTISNTATTTFNGPQNTNGNFTVSGASSTVLWNSNRSGTGTVAVTGANSKLFVNGSKTGGGGVTINSSATLAGTGSIDGAVTNNGIIAPGTVTFTPGTLTLPGTVTNNANSHWLIGLEGTSAGNLVIGGDVNLSAVDNLDVIGTGTGSSWVIATYSGTRTGTFDNVTPGYMVDYGTGFNSQITLSLAGLPGDWNGDGKVDAADYVFWRKTGINGPSGYDAWRTHFGEPGGSGSVAGANVTVPEPATLMSLIVAAVGIGMRRRQIAKKVLSTSQCVKRFIPPL